MALAKTSPLLSTAVESREKTGTDTPQNNVSFQEVSSKLTLVQPLRTLPQALYFSLAED